MSLFDTVLEKYKDPFYTLELVDKVTGKVNSLKFKMENDKLVAYNDSSRMQVDENGVMYWD